MGGLPGGGMPIMGGAIGRGGIPGGGMPIGAPGIGPAPLPIICAWKDAAT